MPRAKQLVEGEWYHLERKWSQQCCHCGLVHDWQMRVENGRIEGKLVVNNRATASARRPLKKKVLIIE